MKKQDPFITSSRSQDTKWLYDSFSLSEADSEAASEVASEIDSDVLCIA